MGLFSSHENAAYQTSCVVRSFKTFSISTTATTYGVGKQIGVNIPVTPDKRQLGRGITLEQIAIIDPQHIKPDLDLVIFSDTPSAGSFTDAAYPTIASADYSLIVGIINIRGASGHWTDIYSGGSASLSVATVEPYTGFEMVGNSPTSVFNIGVFAASSFLSGGGALRLNVHYRQG